MRQKDLINYYYVNFPHYLEDIKADLLEIENSKKTANINQDDVDYQEAYDSDLVD